MKNTNDTIIKSTLSSIIGEYMVANHGEVSVIDYGCGYAPYAEYIQHVHGANYLGVDISSECLEYVRSKGYRACNPNEISPNDRFDIMLLGNMGGIDVGKQLVSVRKKMKEKSSVIVWDTKVTNLPNGSSQDLLVLSVTSKEG